ncbi:MAG TPA: RluA family pseudouridine synthase [Pyrinomonadaceae bacterium]|nr:RluA family pseudouridine synthase [Pyrinomonadaceae bacterium]
MLVRFGIQVKAQERRMRLEDFLFDHFRTHSKLYLRDQIKQGQCEVNGVVENRGFRLRPDDFVEIEIDPDLQNSMIPQDIPLEIIFEDEHLFVLNKPAGMLVHPSHREKTGTILNALSFHANREGTAGHVRPGLVHRLDKDTSGLMVASKSVRAHAKLATQFEKKRVEKRYSALVEGRVADDSGTIELPIGRYVEQKFWGIREDGRPAVSRFYVIERYDDATLIDLEPVTGRTNQLRIHCAALGHPIVGDVARGGREFQRLCLHAYRLAFQHPSDGAKIAFERREEFVWPPIGKRQNGTRGPSSSTS